jgi:hypothetical protein
MPRLRAEVRSSTRQGLRRGLDARRNTLLVGRFGYERELIWIEAVAVPLQLVQEPRVLRFCPPEIGVLVAKQKHDSGRKKMDQRRSKEKREQGGRRGDRAASGKGASRGKR